MTNLNTEILNQLNDLIGPVTTRKLEKAFKDQEGNIDIQKLYNSSDNLLSELITAKYAQRLKSAFGLFVTMNKYCCFKDYIAEGINSPELVADFLRSNIAYKEREFFNIIFLNSQNKIIGFKELFSGTINQAQIYPREVIKEALAHNASAVIISHNHPSGESTPSADDLRLTESLTELLKQIEIRLHDHIIVSSKNMYSIKARRYI